MRVFFVSLATLHGIYYLNAKSLLLIAAVLCACGTTDYAPPPVCDRPLVFEPEALTLKRAFAPTSHFKSRLRDLLSPSTVLEKYGVVSGPYPHLQ